MQGKGSAAPLKISAGNNLVPVGVCQAVSTQPSATARAQKTARLVLPLACRSVTRLPQITSNNLGPRMSSRLL